MYNANYDQLLGFSMPKVRSAGEVPMLSSTFALNISTGAAEGYMEFQEQIWSNNLIDRFEELGTTAVNVLTFQNNDGNHSAASAYNRVMKVAASSNFTLINNGALNHKVLAKAKELQAAEQAQISSSEFDEKTQAVIKQSLAITEKISECMATKDDLQSLGLSSQKSLEEIKEQMAKEHAAVVSSLGKTISELEQTVRDKQNSITFCEDKIHKQSYILAKLNAERDQMTKEMKSKDQQIIERDQRILKLQEENHVLKMNGGGTLEEMKTMLTELWQESKKQRN